MFSMLAYDLQRGAQVLTQSPAKERWAFTVLVGWRISEVTKIKR